MKRALAYSLIVSAALANGGCLAILAGAGVVGGCCGVAYVYAKGKLCGTYQTSVDNAWSAARAGLADLGMPVVKENLVKGFIDSKTADGACVRVSIHSRQSRIPADGLLTDICVRVGVFGDKVVSERILDQIGMHLHVPAVPCPCDTATSPVLTPPVPTAPGR
jgi:hypothetical protein